MRFVPVLPLVSLLALHAGAADRPNIVFAFADDWGRYAGCLAALEGESPVQALVHTPNVDRVAREGVLFRRAFVNAPSCTPCRSSILSGQYFFRTGRGAILQGAIWDETIPTYPLLLEQSGYHIGHTYKVWSPGTPADAGHGGKRTAYVKAGGRFNQFSQNASKRVGAGRTVAEAKAELLAEVRGNFAAFLAARTGDQPYCYWFGPTNTHRKWTAGSGQALWGVDPDSLAGKLPSFFPEDPVIREDFADYIGEIMAFDAGLGVILGMLEERGELDNTLVVVSGDHGPPGFPRGKCNLYDFGTAVTLAIRPPAGFPRGRVVDDFVTLMDLAPTFLDAGGVPVPDVMTARSLMPVLKAEGNGQIDPRRDSAITGRERHVAKARDGNLPYPQRAIRTDDFLYIINFEPDRWPMGSPMTVTADAAPSDDALTNDTFAAFGDFDASPTKARIIARRNEPGMQAFYDFAFGKRPAEELYVLSQDPEQVRNQAANPEYEAVRKDLRARLLAELERVEDPRVTEHPPRFEAPPFTSP